MKRKSGLAMNRREFVTCSAAGVTALASGMAAEGAAPAPAAHHRVYSRLLDPRENPDYARHAVQAPSWDTFGHHTHFSYGGFSATDGVIVDPAAKLHKWMDPTVIRCADVVQGYYNLLDARNLQAFAEELRRRGVFLNDVEGYIPGCGPGGGMVQYTLPDAPLDLLEAILGDHWLGMSNAEQDGRYIALHAPQLYPSCASRLEQYLNFHRHFEQMHNDNGNRMMTIISLNFGHYLLKEGIYTLHGAETAQALPNDQLYYSFIRGAGKQYGVPWWAIISSFNRWGYKSYPREGDASASQGEAGWTGPTKGVSLSMMKRLRYSQILYNCAIVAFEHCCAYGDSPPEPERLSPVGALHSASSQWAGKVGSVEQVGTMLTPVAVMLDFFAGWTFPRHLYTRNMYRVWDNLPYQAGDYLTHGVLNMLYPTYQECSYYHDETGFLSPTPYGDCVDCLLSDAEGWLLERYPLLVIGGELTGGLEMRDRLRDYLTSGGHLVITAGSLAKLPGGLAGVRVAGPARTFPAGSTVRAGRSAVREAYPFELHPLALPAGARVIARCGGVPAAVEVASGAGTLTVLASPFAVSPQPAVKAPVVSKIDEPFANPHPLLEHARRILDAAFQRQMLFEVGDGLSLITCRKGPGEYTLGICNNTLREQPLQIVSHCGPLEAVEEMPLDQAEKAAIGYMPEGFEKASLGASSKTTIAGGDTRLFTVRVPAAAVEDIPHRAAPARPHGRFLPLRGRTPIQEEVLARPTFFEHFDGVAVDWKYLHEREIHALQHEARWIALQKLRVVVDLTSGINLYPNLRLIENDAAQYAASVSAIESVITRMEALGARDLIVALHQTPELFFTTEQTLDSSAKTLRRLAAFAAERHVDLHLRVYRGKLPGGAYYNVSEPPGLDRWVQFLARVGAPNLRLAASTAYLLADRANSKQNWNLTKDNVGMWLVSAPGYDMAGYLWDVNGRVAAYSGARDIAAILAIAPGAPMLLDAVYENADEEYLDACALRDLAGRPIAASGTVPGPR